MILAGDESRTGRSEPYKPHASVASPSKGELDQVKVRPSVKRICEKCKVIRRHGKVMVICENPRHKQTQG